VPSTVLLVHGLWMSGFELTVLKRRIEADPQFRAVTFSYRSIAGTMNDHVRALADFAVAQKTQQLHFIGHSLGGLVILRALQLAADLPPGRAVLLGTPSQGCRAARRIARWPFGKQILGAAVNEDIVECVSRQWSGPRDVGVIAGSKGLGMGRLIANLDGPHDGTVLVEETLLPGAKDHIVLSTSHTGMLFSAEVAEQATYFLREGRFRREAGR
jgi:pimeloyl-ACP methyl ester carboxylesterase